MPKHQVIEAEIRETLRGDALQNALDFTAFLRTNGISPEFHESGTGWSLLYAEKSIGYVIINGAEQVDEPWIVWFNFCDFGCGEAVDEDVKETAWAHASICGNYESGGKNCGCGDQPGFHRTIFGRDFENRCHSPLMFISPDAKTLGNIEKLLLLLKENICAC